jgi:hypothetical protein
LLSLLADKYITFLASSLFYFPAPVLRNNKGSKMFLSKIPSLSSAAKQLVTKKGPQFSAAAAAQVKPNPNPEIKHTGVRKEHTKTFTINMHFGWLLGT